MFAFHLSVSRLVCSQNYKKTTEHISTEPGWRIGLGPEQTSITFEVVPDKQTDPRFVSHFIKHFERRLNMMQIQIQILI